MNIEIGNVVGVEVKKNQGGANEVIMLQCAVTSEDDIRSVELLSLSGIKSKPRVGAVVIILTIGSSSYAIAADDKLAIDIADGELELYSIETESKKTTVKLLTSGVLELNGNDDFAVRYSALETAINEIKGVLNTHVHSGVTPGLGNSSTLTVPSVADITLAKVSKVKLPAEI